MQIKIRRRYILVGAALLALGLAIFIPRRDNLDACLAMYQRGEYSSLNRRLERVLNLDPNWHEARKLLVKSQVAAKEPVAALDNMLYLLAAGESSSQDRYILHKLARSEELLKESRVILARWLEREPDLDEARVFWIELETHADNPAADSSAALNNLFILAQAGKSPRRLDAPVARICTDPEACLALLDQALIQQPDFVWAREMKLQIALEHKLAPLTYSLLKEALESGSGQQDLLSRAWGTILPENCTGSLELALLARNQDWIQQVLERAEMPDFDYQELPQLLELLPQEPRLLLLKALAMEDPREGLDILLDLEESGYEPQDYLDYARKKMSLINQIGHCNKDWLTYVPVDLIAEQALRWGDSRARGLVDWLEAKSEDSKDQVDMLREICEYQGKKAKPIASLSFCPVDLALSPDGKWLLASDPESQMVFLDLTSGKEYPVEPWWGTWVWSPDSKRVAAIWPGHRSNTLYLYTPTTQAPKVVSLPQHSFLPRPEILGWLDNATLLLSSPLSPGVTRSIAVAVNVDTGEIQWESEVRKARPLLTPAGTLAWIWYDQGNLCIDRDGKVTTFNLGSDFIDVRTDHLEWFPKGDRLLTQCQHYPYVRIFDLNSGEVSIVKLPFYLMPGNWADNDSIWGLVSTYSYQSLARLNLKTGKQQRYAGLHFPGTGVVHISQRDLIAIGTNQGDTTVYKIP